MYSSRALEFRFVSFTWCQQSALRSFWQQEALQPSLLDIDEYFGKENASVVAEEVIQTISQTPDGLARILINRPRQSWSRDFSPLKLNPIVEVLPKKYCCPDVGLLCRLLADGIYWILVKAYGNKSSQFKTLFGEIFESYTNRVIEQFCYGGSLLARTFFPNPKFEGTNDQVCDSILCWTQTAVIAEYKAGLLTTHQKFSADQATLLKAIDDLLMRHPQSRQRKGSKKGVGQLADTLERILKNERICAGEAELPDLSNHKLLPTIIVYDHLLGMHTLQRRADRMLRELLDRKEIQNDRIGPVIILTIDDIELLETLQSQASIEQILNAYADFLTLNSKDRTGSFRDFAFNHYQNWNCDPNTFVKNSASTLFQQTIDELRNYQQNI